MRGCFLSNPFLVARFRSLDNTLTL
uniref:Uncharacterized protein n=1 Tax=Arundo donax TaxID=35708 RepID=A0A0A9GJ74_ARUDO